MVQSPARRAFAGGIDGSIMVGMSEHRNPRAEQMTDESMVRNLRAQADAIRPQERSLLACYGRPSHIADIDCGSGQITARLTARHLHAEIVGAAILESSVAHAP